VKPLQLRHPRKDIGRKVPDTPFIQVQRAANFSAISRSDKRAAVIKYKPRAR